MAAPSAHYFDNNATTALDPAARAAMEPFLGACFANPSSPYTLARASSLALLGARERVAALIGAAPERIVFTSGGTESNNTALRGAPALRPGRRRIVTSGVEHASVREVLADLEQQGWRVTRVAVDGEGRLDPGALRAALADDVALVSVMAAHNETGHLFPVRELAELAHRCGALFHTDAVQAAGRIPIDVRELGVDLLSLCAHKMHGPKGAGALYAREGVDLPPLLRGGEQERGRRAGTENVPALAGFGAAAEVAAAALPDLEGRVRALRDRAEQALLALGGVRVVAAATPRLPNTSLLLIDGADTEALLARLDMLGFCCSSGSACESGAAEPSPALRAMGVVAAGASARVAVLRLSWSRFNGAADTESLVDAVSRSVKELRRTPVSAR